MTLQLEAGVQIRDVPTFPGYTASSDGIVFGLDGNQLSPNINRSNGAWYVNLCRNGVRYHLKISVIMLRTFVGPKPKKGMVARHLDDNQSHNAISNLVWGTHTENMYELVRNGKHEMAKKTHCKRKHEFTPENTKLIPHTRKDGTIGYSRQCRKCKQDWWRNQEIERFGL
jgi:hypothetical protein